MARIPIYTRQVGPEAGTAIDLPRMSADATVGALGDGLARLGWRMDQSQARRAAEADNQAVTDAGLKIATFEAETAKAAQQARATAPADGAGHAEAVLADFDARRAALIDSIDNPRARTWAERQLIEARGRLDVSESGYARGLAAQKVAGDFQQQRDLVQNNLYTSPTRANLDAALAAQESLIGNLAVPADLKQKLAEETRQGLALSYAQGLAERDPYQLRSVVDGGQLNALLDPQAMAALRNRADSEIRGREAAARAEAAQRRAEQAAAEREARAAERERASALMDLGRDIQAGLSAGVVYAPAEVAQVVGAVARLPGGKALARNVALLSEQNATAVALRGASPVQLQDSINGLTAAAAAGGRDAPVLQARLAAAKAAQAAQKSGLAADPLSYATTQGVVALRPLAPGDAASARQRVVDARKVKARYGGPLTVLTDEEAAAYQSRLWSGDANQRMAALTELRSLGSEGSAAALRQIGRGRPVEAQAGRLLGSPAGAQTAGMILKGMDRIKADPKAVPSAASANEVAGDALGNALKFLPDLRAAIPDTARAYLAGIGGGDDEGWLKRVMRSAASGGWRGGDGIVRGGIGARRGHDVLLPDSVSEDGFNDAMDRLSAGHLPADLRPVWSNGKPVDDATLRRAYPFAVGDGRYVLAADPDGERLFRMPDGKPWQVQVK